MWDKWATRLELEMAEGAETDNDGEWSQQVSYSTLSRLLGLSLIGSHSKQDVSGAVDGQMTRLKTLTFNDLGSSVSNLNPLHKASQILQELPGCLD